jgi:hypothetical protein
MIRRHKRQSQSGSSWFLGWARCGTRTRTRTGTRRPTRDDAPCSLQCFGQPRCGSRAYVKSCVRQVFSDPPHAQAQLPR